ncbi:hypothetical protein FJZ36_01555 [Candidatus Poribacteria bacterium]|nr:hypothetical protein [Candidatus Poribacteria bacterium]
MTPMMATKRRFLLRIAVFTAVWSCATAVHAEVERVYLTWQADPATTMTVTYHTPKPSASSLVYYDTEPRGGDPAAYAHHASGKAHQISGLPIERWIHDVPLWNLSAGTTYYFVAGDPEQGFTAERKFRTLPAEEPYRFATGGDMNSGERTATLVKIAAAQDPAFVLVGGDIAYANGNIEEYKDWDAWFESTTDLLVSPDGYTIPIVLAIGNHESNWKTGLRFDKSPFYFGYFAQRRISYWTMPVGENSVFYILDSGIVADHDGPQAAWLRRAMERYRGRRHQFAVYHIPLYPSHRAYDGSLSVRGREVWGPLFDEFGLTAAFENHDHTFKRSKLLKANREDPQGTLYLGDGCFGVGARTVDDPRWYLERMESIPHVWLVDVTASDVRYRAFDESGKVFDVYPPQD